MSFLWAIVPAHEGILESKIEESLETIDNPFQSKFEVVGIAKRTSKQGRKDAAQHSNDKDIQREIQQHGEENVHIIQDSDP